MANRRPLVIDGNNRTAQFDGSADTLDVNGALTATGAVIVDGASASLEVPNAAGGRTVDAAGEITVDTTSKTLNFHDGTAERALIGEYSKSITIKNPTNAEDNLLFFTNKAITVTEMRASLVGSSTPSVTWTVRHHATDRSNAGNEVVTSGTTTTSTTSGSDVTSFNDATIPADSFVWMETTAKSGTVDELGITVFFTVDA